MTHPAQQRCFNHPGREAAARCPVCARHFCRECVTEHHGRVICSACLLAGRQAPRSQSRLHRAGLAAAAGILLAWMIFYGLGQILLNIPSAVHEGRYWKASDAAP
ncbi:MAG: hypothetical protein A2498_04720 [Lentisphaerae bacterium RIFOXYC12_FULL_60_16]|nr:MAG: hypothetical protein A2498_04720 [Lentisphaerae bacterium RIFOXYC12_FULL_60_16]OGV77937.1 MAG: hypothetical protein A2340_10230 [Lentisphaerae bacterium RIFOXYB12_FULL_60_10]